jgi:uncharacterized protein (DUF736 family)
MPTIANLSVKDDGSFEGTLATLNVTAQIAIVPNGRKAKDSEPEGLLLRRGTRRDRHLLDLINES